MLSLLRQLIFLIKYLFCLNCTFKKLNKRLFLIKIKKNLHFELRKISHYFKMSDTINEVTKIISNLNKNHSCVTKWSLIKVYSFSSFFIFNFFYSFHRIYFWYSKYKNRMYDVQNKILHINFKEIFHNLVDIKKFY